MAVPPPTGTLTLLFTDLEGSSQIWDRLGSAFFPVLDRHNALMRAAIERWDGYEVKTQGDSFMVAFQDAAKAVRCAVEFQRALEQEEWGPQVGELRVRIGIHAGEPMVTPLPSGIADYFGPVVNRAARLEDAAHGGQILLSAAACELAAPALGAEFELVNMGSHRLRGLEEPEQIYSVRHPDLKPRQHPPLRTLDQLRTNLPERNNSFVGREQELQSLRRTLMRPETRLLTLLGFGGTGKTSLALQIAERCAFDFSDGAWWVEAEEATSSEQLVQRIAFQLRVHLEPTPSVREQLIDFLREKELLLVLDNTEQIPDIGGLVAALIQPAARLKCLVTTRCALDIRYEVVAEVPPLPVPDAVTLFVDRARARRPGFESTPENQDDIARLCGELECVPLAIELAASRVVGMTPREILARLNERFRLLQTRAPDLPPRQRALRGAIDWSFELLGAEDRSLLAQLSVFTGGFTLEDVEGVVDTFDAFEGVNELRRHSLLRSEVDPAGQVTRYQMLESVREYAAEKLSEAGPDPGELRGRHAAYFLRLGESKTAHMRTEREAAALDELEPAYENLRAALGWALAEGDAGMAGRLGVVQYHFLFRRGFWGEARACLLEALERVEQPGGEPAALRASLLHYLSTMEIDMDGLEELAREHETTSLQLRRELGDRSGIAESLNHLANSEIRAGYWSRAQARLEEALKLVPEGDAQRRGILLHSLGRVANGQGDAARARELYEQALAARRAGGDYRGEAETLGNLGVLAHNAGHIPAARALYQESLVILRRLRDRFAIGVMLFNLAELAELERRHAEAAALYFHAERLFLDLQSPHARAAHACLQQLSTRFSAEEWEALLAVASRKGWEELA